ncbi:MAG: hypothetical protein KGQ52_14750 [Alphaproteobacteria bacterium]|nr:hypothetical protein [Alphaproteobacteria bacterium]
MSIFLKDPASLLDHAVDWGSQYLAGRSISASQWRVEPDQAGVAAGLSLALPQIAGGRTLIRIGGGQAGQVYRVVNRVNLSDGNSDERTLLVRVEER